MEKEISCIMLIDDHHPTNVLHSLVIQKCNCSKSVIIFDDGQNALMYFREPFGITHPKPAIIFLDINMPGMTGWEFLEEYKNLSEDKKSGTQLLMLSTSLHPEDLEKAEMEVIVKDYIHKPLTVEIMKDVIKRYFITPQEKRA